MASNSFKKTSCLLSKEVLHWDSNLSCITENKKLKIKAKGTIALSTKREPGNCDCSLKHFAYPFGLLKYIVMNLLCGMLSFVCT